jgi:hypothetical protein
LYSLTLVVFVLRCGYVHSLRLYFGAPS